VRAPRRADARSLSRLSLISQRPRGMVFSADDAGCFAPILWNWPAKEVDAIVLTDGSRVLGLGDLGANGLAISIGKLNLYCAAAGCGVGWGGAVAGSERRAVAHPRRLPRPPSFHPSRVLPIVLDVGTDNKTLRADPAYGGLARERLTGDAYFALLDELVTALTTRYPKAVLQFEDFSTDVASIALERYRSHHLTFNDDIQGTAATAVAGLHGALKANGLPSQALTDQKIVVVGAGSAGLGVVRMVAASMRALGAAPAAAAARFWVLDAHGLVTRARGTFLDPAVAPFARPAGGGDVEGENLLDVVSRVKPDVLIGLSGAGRLFTPAVLAALSAGVPDGRRPVVMPLSNPQSRMECLAADAAAATGGRAIFASGSPQADVNLPGGGVMRSSQANNMYVFPGLALGAFLGETGAVTDAMLAAAAEALPALIDPADSAEGAIYPKLSAIREISTQVAAAVMRAADSEGRVGSAPARAALAAGATALEAHIKNRMYNPVYKPLIRLPVGVME